MGKKNADAHTHTDTQTHTHSRMPDLPEALQGQSDAHGGTINADLCV